MSQATSSAPYVEDQAGAMQPSISSSFHSPAATPAATAGAGSFSASEKHAVATITTIGTTSSTSNAKQRSCIVCRQRKVRCDKLSPCSNCRRADIPCVFPSTERPPRWARRLKQQQQQQQPTQQVGAPGGSLTPLPASHDADHSDQPSPATISSVARDQGPLGTRASPVVATYATAHSGSIAGVGTVLERLKHLEALVSELSSSAIASSQPALFGGSMPASQRGFIMRNNTIAAVSPGTAAPPSTSAPSSTSTQADTGSATERFGRLILDDDISSRSRYVSSGFWTKINDELDELRAETGNLANNDEDYSTEDDSDLDEEQAHSPTRSGPSSNEASQRTAAERHAFLFSHNLHSPLGDTADYRPLPSQIPFLFQVYVININMLGQFVHVPTINKLIAGMLGNRSIEGEQQQLSPASEALMFSIYYAAVVSMEDEDVVKNFASSKAELSLKYRLGFELSLAKADFLNTTDLVLVQALLIFLVLVRRHDSPQYVWMMTGLLIRMGQSLGLQRDGSNFGQSLSPYEVEIRRRVWWMICAVDVRSSEDQGTDLTIQPGSFDTRLPLNINDNDISPEIKETPAERHELTDMTYALLSYEITKLAQQMMALAASASKQAGGSPNSTSGAAMSPAQKQQLLEEQSRLLDEVYQRLDSVYLRHSPDTSSIIYWTSVTIARLVMAKMTLILYLPTLLSDKTSSNQQKLLQQQDIGGSEELRTRLLTSAIEVAEYNHALNAERACRRWRWLFETYTQWHAIAFLLMETGRRPWDPAVERAWAALHSHYLIPKPLQSGRASTHPTSRATSVSSHSGGASSNNSSSSASVRTQFFWLPLQRLLARARRHRARELERLRADTKAARSLEISYDIAVAEGRSRPLSNPAAVDLFRERWRKLVGLNGPRSSRSSKSKSPLAMTATEGTDEMTASTDLPGVQPITGIPPYDSSPSTNAAGLSSSAGITGGDFPGNGVDTSIFDSAREQRHPPPVQQHQQAHHTERREPGQGPLANNFDPWKLWASPDQSNSSIFGGLDGGYDMSLTFDEDVDVDMDVETNIDWDNWFATAKGI